MNFTLEIKSAKHEHSSSSIELWSMGNFAEQWFNDASDEARTSGPSSRRREILFAVCFAESYLFEWVRGILPPSELNSYFPSGKKRGVCEKWKEVPKQLFKDNIIPAPPDLSGNTWNDFDRLVTFRDGLVHASCSRPQAASTPQDYRPVPSPEELAILQPGWALRAVKSLIQELHTKTQTQFPAWLDA